MCKTVAGGQSHLSRALPKLALLSLGVVLALAGWLRVAGYNWDQDQHINVDDYYVAKVTFRQIQLPPDTSLGTLADPRASPLNPHLDRGFVYGALPLYLVKGITVSLTAATGNPYFASLDGTLQTGRILSGLFDLITVPLVFLIGLRLWGAWPGVVASALYAFSLLPIQLGHFYINEPFMTTFMTASLFFSILFLQEERAGFLLVAALCAGLAMACKLSAAPAVALPLIAVPLLMRLRRERGTVSIVRNWKVAVGLLALAALGVGLGLFIGDPFAVLDARYYLDRMGEQATTQNGANDLWFTRKYVGTWPIVYPWGQLMLIGSGPLTGVLGTLGLGLVVARSWRERNWTEALLPIGALIYFASIALWEIKWVRYLIPLVPYLCLFATTFAFWLVELGLLRRLRPVFGTFLLGLLLAMSAAGAFALSTIYTSEHTQIRASRWVYDNAQTGSRIGIEETAITMPLPLPGRQKPDERYRLIKVNTLADMPSAQAAETLRAHLASVDYLILDTTQAARTAPRLPWRYPVQIRYYELLFSGKLGFRTAFVSTSYPRLLGVEVPDDNGWVDASFMDSSHPPIWVFKKERDLSRQEWDALFASAVQQPSVATRQAP